MTPDIDTVDVCNAFVIEHAVPEADVVTWCHVGIDDHYHPTGGYWLPTDLVFDPETSGQVRRKTEIPRRDLIQYPAEPTAPELKGTDYDADDLPDHVKNRTVSDGSA